MVKVTSKLILKQDLKDFFTVEDEDKTADLHLQGLEKEISLLKSELGGCKNAAMQSGAKMALEKANSAFSAAAFEYETSVRSTLDVLRQRVSELVDFMEKLFGSGGDGLLDSSMMTTSFKDALRRSIEEGRR